MNKIKNFVTRVVLFSFILSLGTTAALLAGETRSLALADLSEASLGAMTRAAHGDTIYAALGGDKQGIYRSQNSGLSWQWIGRGLKETVAALAVHPTNHQVLYAATEGNLWFSKNGGRKWTLVKPSLPVAQDGQPATVTVLTVAPNHPGKVYIGTQGQGIFIAENGRLFSRIGGPALKNLYIKELLISPDSQIYALSTEGLLVIKGSAWRKVETLLDLPVSLAIDPTNPGHLYAGTAAYGLYRSTDGGKTWQAANKGLGWQPGVMLRITALAIDKDNPRHLALATAYSVGRQIAPDHIFESYNSGHSWSKVAATHTVVNRLTLKNKGIYAATAGGLVRYGAPLPQPTQADAPLRLSLLANPSGVQALIMVLTLAMAGLVLAGRTEWILKAKQAATLAL